MKHTPTPWHTASDQTDYFRCIEKDDRPIARLQTSDSIRDEANAAFIVNAVNVHDEMLAAAILALDWIEGDEVTHGRNFKAGDALRAAIIKAEGR